jgi:hypothetical protein
LELDIPCHNQGKQLHLQGRKPLLHNLDNHPSLDLFKSSAFSYSEKMEVVDRPELQKFVHRDYADGWGTKELLRG